MQKRQGRFPQPVPAKPAGVVSLSFADGDQFNEAMRHEDAEVVQIKPGRFQNAVTLVTLPDMAMRFGTNEMPWLCSATAMPGHVSLVMVLESGGPVFQNGWNTADNCSFALHGSGAEHFSRTEASTHVYLPVPEELFLEACRVAGVESACPRTAEFRFVQSSEERWHMLRRTMESVRSIAEAEPHELDDPVMRAAIQQFIISELVLAASSRDEKAPRLASRPGNKRHTSIVRHAQEYLRAREHEPVYVLDLCRATGTSERTLREAFQENCGMGPMNYLKLRRLREVHRRLRDSSGGETSVKAIALENGFWDLGRFAVEYRQLFGEAPSETLRRSTRDGICLALV